MSEPAGGWEDVVARLPLRGMGRELAQNCVLLERTDALVRLALDKSKAHLLTERLRGGLEKALGDYYGAPLKLKVEVSDQAGDSPAARQAEAAASRESELRTRLDDDPHVNALRQTFGAELMPGTLREERGS